jgi:hypothetical protein
MLQAASNGVRSDNFKLLTINYFPLFLRSFNSCARFTTNVGTVTIDSSWSRFHFQNPAKGSASWIHLYHQAANRVRSYTIVASM